MGIGVRAQKTLWGRAAGRCSLPECRNILFEEDDHASDPTLIGENCHIVAEADDGPRADMTMPVDARNAYSNLILCCRNHHKVIDTQVKFYSVPELHRIKGEHEAWVREQLGLDLARQRDEELYAGYIDMWEKLAHVDDWTAWTSWLLSAGQPRLSAAVDDDLSRLRSWLVARIWPGRYPSLEAAFGNFGQVLQDLQERFRSHLEKPGGSRELWTRKFYQIDDWDPERYARLSKRYDFHVDLVCDLALELTRAGNLLCDRIREVLMPSYRVAQGRLIVQSGPNEDFMWQEFVTLYSADEMKRVHPYPGLDGFMSEREARDRHFGSGVE